MTNPGRVSAPSGTIRLGRLRGIDLLIRPSLLFMAAVLISLFAPRFATNTNTNTNSYVLASLFVFALYASVLVHEIAHVVLARHYRMPVASITLHLLGGETAIEGESRGPAQEFWTSIVGPLASLGIGAIAWIIAGQLDTGDAHDVMSSIAAVNIVVAVFNLVPGLPLDGGRVLRSIVWGTSGNEATGTKAAGWLGRIFAVVVLIVPVLWLIRDQDSSAAADLIVGILVAWFLWTGAGHALRTADRSARLNKLNARTLGQAGVNPPVGSPPLPADLSGASLLRAMAGQPSDVYRLTENDGSTYGQLLADRVDDAYREPPAKDPSEPKYE
ncbi:MAG: site-2 protease family protein [Aeromicrobium sp.]